MNRSLTLVLITMTLWLGACSDEQGIPDQGQTPDQNQAGLDAATDAAVVDATLPDLAGDQAVVQPDVAAPDVAAPDVAAPDVAAPDLPAPDLLAPDLPSPDLPVPDLPVPDLLIPDLPPPTCTDAVKNGDETDVDCGGSTCAPCAAAKKCAGAADCQSGVCAAGVCAAPSCTDAVKNGDETDVDCGGSTCTPCAAGKACKGPSDCGSAVCSAGLCVAASCTDAVKNGDESDIDCGGSTCAPCAVGKKCTKGSNCASGVCTSGVCVKGSCTDTVKNGDETDIDCGGSCPKACGTGKGCKAHKDCYPGVCGASSLCAPAASCAKLLAAHASAPTGVYAIQPTGAASAFSAYCEMTMDGGGWTLIASLNTAITKDYKGYFDVATPTPTNTAALGHFMKTDLKKIASHLYVINHSSQKAKFALASFTGPMVFFATNFYDAYTTGADGVIAGNNYPTVTHYQVGQACGTNASCRGPSDKIHGPDNRYSFGFMIVLDWDGGYASVNTSNHAHFGGTTYMESLWSRRGKTLWIR